MDIVGISFEGIVAVVGVVAAPAEFDNAFDGGGGGVDSRVEAVVAPAG